MVSIISQCQPFRIIHESKKTKDRTFSPLKLTCNPGALAFPAAGDRRGRETWGLIIGVRLRGVRRLIWIIITSMTFVP